MLPFLALGGGITTWEPSIALVDYVEDLNSGQAFDFYNVYFGAADTNRHIIVFVSCQDDQTSGSVSLLSASIGGVTATIHEDVSISDGETLAFGGIFSAIVPTGVLGTVSITLDATQNMNNCVITVLSIIRDDTNITELDSDITISAVSDSVAATLSMGDYAVFGFISGSDNVLSVTWQNATELVDEDVEDSIHSVAYLLEGDSASETATVYTNAGTDNIAVVGVSWNG